MKYTEVLELNKKRVEENKELYKQRQSIVGHPYGTIKRQWGFSYIRTKKTIQRASADGGIMMVIYNLRRIDSIIGINEFKEDLKKVIILF